MQRTFLLGKIHNCRITDSNLNYMGSIGIDQGLLDAAGIEPHEQVQVLNITTGARLTTYAIALEAVSPLASRNEQVQAPVTLKGYHPLEEISPNDERMLATCQNEFH